MSGVADEKRALRTWERYGAWLWLIGAVQFVFAMLMVEFAYGCANAGGCYNAFANPISDLGSAGFAGSPSFFTYQGFQYPWPYSPLWPLFDYSVFVLGALLFTGLFFLQSMFPRSKVSRAAMFLVGLAALATAGVGVIPEDTLLAAHSAFALTALLAMALALVLMGFAFASDRGWGETWGRISLIMGSVSAAVFVLLVLPYAGILPPWAVFGPGLGLGLLERVGVAIGGLWILWLAIRTLRRGRATRSTPSMVRPGAAADPLALEGEASQRRQWEGYGAWILLLGLIQFVAAMVAGQFAYSCSNYGGCYNFISNPISDFGSAGFTTGNPAHMTYLNLSLPWPTALLWPVFNYSIMLFGTCLLAGAFLVRSAFPRTNWSGFALSLVAVGGMGAAGVGVVPEDTLLAAHATFALIAFGLAALGVLAMGIALAVDRSWGRGWTVYTLASGLVAIPVVAIFTVPSLVGVSAWAPFGSTMGYGGMERLIIVAPLLWVGVAMVYLLRRPAIPRTESFAGRGPDNHDAEPDRTLSTRELRPSNQRWPP